MGCLALIVLVLACGCPFLCLFLTVPWDGMWSLIVTFPGQTHLFCLTKTLYLMHNDIEK